MRRRRLIAGVTVAVAGSVLLPALMGVNVPPEPRLTLNGPSDPGPPAQRGPAAPADDHAPAAACSTPRYEPGDSIRLISTPDGDREYRLHVPPSFDGMTRLPLVLNFHGYGQDAAQQESDSGLRPIADREAFLLVSPEGSGDPRGWAIPGIYNETGVDELSFVAAIVASAVAEGCADADRIYATGMSNGGEMAVYAACELGDLFAAVAPVAGFVASCDGAPVPVIAFHGTWDSNVPIELALAAALTWAAANGCQELVSEPLDGADERWSWVGCLGAPVELYVLSGWGHAWPGAIDDGTPQLNASELMWAYFQAHPRGAP